MARVICGVLLSFLFVSSITIGVSQLLLQSSAGGGFHLQFSLGAAHQGVVYLGYDPRWICAYGAKRAVGAMIINTTTFQTTTEFAIPLEP